MLFESTGIGTATVASKSSFIFFAKYFRSVVLPQPVSPAITTVPGIRVPASMSVTRFSKSMWMLPKEVATGSVLGSHSAQMGTLSSFSNPG